MKQQKSKGKGLLSTHAMETEVEKWHEVTASHILDRGKRWWWRWWWSASCASRFTLGQRPMIPTEGENGLAPEPLWMQSQREKSMPLPRINSLFLGQFHSLVTIPPELFLLLSNTDVAHNYNSASTMPERKACCK
jgi:hypothetical protein